MVYSSGEYALTDGANIDINASLGSVFKVTLGGNRTINAPTNPTANQFIILIITQDGTGSRTLTWNAAFVFSTDLPAPTLTTTASKSDMLGFVYISSLSKWRYIAEVQGF